MDEAYANYLFDKGESKERITLDDIKAITPNFVKYYDSYIDLKDMSSVTVEDQIIRINYLEDCLSRVRSFLDSLPEKQEDKTLYLHFVGHGGHDANIDEIQHIHYDYLFPKLHDLFDGYKLTINLLGTCHSIYAKNYLRHGTLLCCSKGTYDYLSPFQYTSLKFYEEGDIEGFIEKCGNSGGYQKIVLE